MDMGVGKSDTEGRSEEELARMNPSSLGAFSVFQNPSLSSPRFNVCLRSTSPLLTAASPRIDFRKVDLPSALEPMTTRKSPAAGKQGENRVDRREELEMIMLYKTRTLTGRV